MLLNVRMGTGLLLGTMEVPGTEWRPGMYLDVMAPVRVSVHDGLVSEHDVTAAGPASVMRLPVVQWVLPGGGTEAGLRVNHAGHAAGMRGMALTEQATVERNMAARTVLLRNRVQCPSWFEPRGDMATPHVDPWSFVSRNFLNLVYEVMEVWNARLLDITPEYVSPDVEARLQRLVGDRMARELDAVALSVFNGTAAAHPPYGPVSVVPRRGCPKPRTTTRVYSMVRRALDV